MDPVRRRLLASIASVSAFASSTAISASAASSPPLQPKASSGTADPGAHSEPGERVRAPGFAWDHYVRVALPSSYSATNRSYPVLWVTDGSAWFDTAVTIVNSYDARYLPEMIVVGVGVPPGEEEHFLTRRLYDFTPSTAGPQFSGFGADLARAYLARDAQLVGATFGGAPAFLSFLVGSLRGDLSQKYRMTGDHTLFGDSGGGIFSTYALFARPDAFSKYICGSPALTWGDDELFRLEQKYAETHSDLKAKVFFGAGEGEVLSGYAGYPIVSATARMAEILQARRYPSLKVHFRIFPDYDHVSVIPSNLTWGLRSLWEGESP